MLSDKNYASFLQGSGIHKITEMDSSYNTRTEIIADSNPTEDVYSVAKAFTATAVGMCVDQGLFCVDDRFVDIMGLSLPNGCDPKWKGVTLSMLLTHKWGITTEGLLDIDVDDASLYPDDYLSIVLSQPLDGEEGAYCYTDAAYYLLSLAVEKASGKTMFDFMRPALMQVMRFGEYAWSCCPLGHTLGATGLYVRCEDIAKLGVLYVNGGVWKGTRLLSEKWCSDAIEKGYCFSKAALKGWYYKSGMHGQMLAFNPERKLSVAWVGHGFKGGTANVLRGI